MPVLLQNDQTDSTNTFKISKSTNFNCVRYLRETSVFEGIEVRIFDYNENYRSIDTTCGKSNSGNSVGDISKTIQHRKSELS
jgi:hypothetical protein